jgi:hypothetical protein
METLLSRETYGPEVALKIDTMGSTAVSVANQWVMGWPDRVRALLAEGTYLSSLTTQVDQEKDVFANETGLRHLSRREILQLYEIRESPP